METFHDNFQNIMIHDYMRGVKITLQLFKKNSKLKLFKKYPKLGKYIVKSRGMCTLFPFYRFFYKLVYIKHIQ